MVTYPLRLRLLLLHHHDDGRRHHRLATALGARYPGDALVFVNRPTRLFICQSRVETGKERSVVVVILGKTRKGEPQDAVCKGPYQALLAWSLSK